VILSALVSKIRATNSNTFAISAEPNQPTPYIVVNLDSTFREPHYGTGTQYANALIDYDFEIQVYGGSQTECIDLANSVRSALEHFAGQLTSLESPVQTYSVMNIEITSEITGYETLREIYYYSLFITLTTGG